MNIFFNIFKKRKSQTRKLVPDNIHNGMKLRVAENSVHSSGAPSAYIGMSGIVENLKEDGSFILNCGNCTLVSPSGKDVNGLRFNGRETKIYYEEVKPLN